MNILYDLFATQPYGRSKYHGGGEYAKTVFLELLQREHEHRIVGVYDKNNEIDETIIRQCSKYNIALMPVNSKYELKDILQRGEFNRFYSAAPSLFYDLDINNIEFIYTIHGLRQVETPTDRYEYKYTVGWINTFKLIYKNLFGNSYKKIKRNQYDAILKASTKRKIIVPSLHTKYSIIANFPYIKPDEIVVLYSPKKRSALNEEQNILEKFNVDKKEYFLLTMGNRWAKNNYRAVMAFDSLFTKFPGINKKVLILGVTNEKVYKSIKNRNMFIFKNYVSENELEIVYKYSYAFIYPTLNEGFGYPPIEAMKYGTLVAAAAITSVTEICGDAALYFNPYSVEEMEDRILDLVYESDYDKRSEKVIDRYKLVSEKQEYSLNKLIEIILA